MASHRIVARSNPHTSLNALPPLSTYTPHTTSLDRVPINSFAPARAALHTLNSRHAPKSPLNTATRANTSRREMAR
jgi:hypothetical protein